MHAYKGMSFLADQFGFLNRERHYLLKLGAALTRIGAPLVPNDGPDSMQVSDTAFIAIVAQKIDTKSS